MRAQYWECESCGSRGSVVYEEHCGVWVEQFAASPLAEVVQRLLDAHSGKAPACLGGRDTIRVSMALRMLGEMSTAETPTSEGST